MFSSLGFAVGPAFVSGITIVVTVAAKAGSDDTIARERSDAERPEGRGREWRRRPVLAEAPMAKTAASAVRSW